MIERRERERRRERKRKERERGERDREVKGIQIPTKWEGNAHGSLLERKILVKSPEPGIKVQRKVEYKNYHAKL